MIIYEGAEGIETIVFANSPQEEEIEIREDIENNKDVVMEWSNQKPQFFSHGTNEVDVIIYNMNGSKMKHYSYNLQPGLNRINEHWSLSLTSGIYVIVYHTGKDYHVEKVFVP